VHSDAQPWRVGGLARRQQAHPHPLSNPPSNRRFSRAFNQAALADRSDPWRAWSSAPPAALRSAARGARGRRSDRMARSSPRPSRPNRQGTSPGARRTMINNNYYYYTNSSSSSSSTNYNEAVGWHALPRSQAVNRAIQR
jgi:hypothetical protein